MDFCLLPKNMVKNITKNFSCKYSQKRLNHAKPSATDKIKAASKEKKIEKEYKKQAI